MATTSETRRPAPPAFANHNGYYHGKVWRDSQGRLRCRRSNGTVGLIVGGAIVARPQVKTVAVMGDGSFGMCVGELETAVRLRMPITFVVISNAVYGWIKAGQKSGFDQRYFSVDFSRTDHAAVRLEMMTRPNRATANSSGGPKATATSRFRRSCQ